MFFAVLTFLAAFAIETIGTIVSVIGLSALFGTNPIIIALAVALDVGKLVVVALLYKYWGELNRLMRVYGLIAAAVTMTITSAGAAGYLSGEFQKAMVGTQEVALKVDLLKEEQARLQARKEQIDQQIAALPERFSAGQRVRMINQFKAEQTTITNRLAEIDRELPTLKVDQINVEAKAGPILYIAKAFDISVEEAVKWVILMIIFVFDPLAVFLIVAGNFLLDKRRRDTEAPITKQQVEMHVRQATPEEIKAAAPIYEILEPTPTPRADQPAQDEKTSADLQFREPTGSDGNLVPLREEPREITKSSLGLVKPDSGTRMADPNEVGYGTGVYLTGAQRPESK